MAAVAAHGFAGGQHNNYNHKPYSSAAEQPLASIMSSLQAFPGDGSRLLPPPPLSTSTAATAAAAAAAAAAPSHAASLITLLTALALILAMLYIIMNDYRRHAVMYAHPLFFWPCLNFVIVVSPGLFC